jgi:hypothetical protein
MVVMESMRVGMVTRLPDIPIMKQASDPMVPQTTRTFLVRHLDAFNRDTVDTNWNPAGLGGFD